MAGVTSGSRTGPEVPTVLRNMPTRAPRDARSRPSPLRWQSCSDAPEADCATLTVPVDWAKPSGPEVDLAVARRKATDPARRIGVMMVDPGGPGGSAAQYAKAAPDTFSPEILARSTSSASTRAVWATATPSSATPAQSASLTPRAGRTPGRGSTSSPPTTARRTRRDQTLRYTRPERDGRYSPLSTTALPLTSTYSMPRGADVVSR
jgi:hypothetical protein